MRENKQSQVYLPALIRPVERLLPFSKVIQRTRWVLRAQTCAAHEVNIHCQGFSKCLHIQAVNFSNQVSDRKAAEPFHLHKQFVGKLTL